MDLRQNMATIAEPAAPAPRAAMSDGDFARLAGRIEALTGIELPPHKHELLSCRLRKRLRKLRIDDFGAYLAYLDSPVGEAETCEMINVVTTNQTGFFREGHHFGDMAQVLAQHPRETGGEIGAARRLRIWSAACSTGEEAYSIAMTLLQAGLARPGVNLRILATDLDTGALSWARTATYPAERITACPPELRKGYFEVRPDGRFRVSGRARSLITFNRLNLHEPWPVSGPFDAIFCRNVLIYFNAEAKRAIVSRFVDLLRPGGTLYLGHSESMLGDHPQLVNQGRTIFRRCA